MMNFNQYMNEIDFTAIKQLFLKKGETMEFKKSDYFLRQGEASRLAGFVKHGIFRDTRIDGAGKEHIVGYSFAGDFVCDYPSFIKHSAALINCQAVTDCTVYLLSVDELNAYWETNMDTQRFGRLVAEELFVDLYRRVLDFYCETPEQRYLALIARCPTLPQHIMLKEIASFLGVTPETISHIRRKLR